MSKLKEIEPGLFLLPKEGDMRVDGLIVASEKILQDIDKALDQVRNVATLQGIQSYSIAMPDIHWGYGFPIGGVAAMDVESGVISPGGVGYDINCGVRLALLEEKFSDFSKDVQEKLLSKIFALVPSGVGHGHRGEGLLDKDFKEIAFRGVKWSIENGMGLQEDISHIESYGCIDGADMHAVSSFAKERGKSQMGTVGSGNHFIEIGQVEELFSPIAQKWKLFQGQTYVLIHTGSRGFGHQVCQDTLNEFLKKGFAKGLVDRQLVCAPIRSSEGNQYLSAMAAAANFAFNNRQHILHYVRQAFKEVLNIPHEKIRTLYDVCHNIAKFETHEVDGREKKLCVHRKGATRAFGPHAKELSEDFQETGQPVIVPGDMQRASYIMVGKGHKKTWMSCCHGAGRAKSRKQALQEWGRKDLKQYLYDNNIQIKASSFKTVAEEMPNCYKDVHDVAAAAEKAGLAANVAKLTPKLIVKG